MWEVGCGRREKAQNPADAFLFEMSIPRFCRPPPAARRPSPVARRPSRVRARIHFRFAIENGLALGSDIGGFAVKTILQPTKVATNTSR